MAIIYVVGYSDYSSNVTVPVPKGTKLRFYADQDHSVGGILKLAALGMPSIRDRYEAFPSLPFPEKGLSVPNYIFHAAAPQAVVASVPLPADSPLHRGELRLIGGHPNLTAGHSELPSGSALCDGTAATCTANGHTCNGVLGLLAAEIVDGEVHFISCRESTETEEPAAPEEAPGNKEEGIGAAQNLVELFYRAYNEDLQDTTPLKVFTGAAAALFDQISESDRAALLQDPEIFDWNAQRSAADIFLREGEERLGAYVISQEPQYLNSLLRSMEVTALLPAEYLIRSAARKILYQGGEEAFVNYYSGLDADGKTYCAQDELLIPYLPASPDSTATDRETDT